MNTPYANKKKKRKEKTDRKVKESRKKENLRF